MLQNILLVNKVGQKKRENLNWQTYVLQVNGDVGNLSRSFLRRWLKTRNVA